MDCGVKCASFPSCNRTCHKYKPETCSRLTKTPYVCNGCNKFPNKCTIVQKFHYDANFADRKYHEGLVNSRSGIPLMRSELHNIDGIVTPLIANGQSPHQIICNHPELDMSVRTLYSYIDKGILTSRNIDLKRKVKFKPRKCHKTQIHTIIIRLCTGTIISKPFLGGNTQRPVPAHDENSAIMSHFVSGLIHIFRPHLKN